MATDEQPYGELVDTTLRALTWNVWGRFGPWEQREAALVATMHATSPDIIFLQESWVDEGGADQASVLGEQLGLEHHCRSEADGGRANAIISRWPLSDVESHNVPSVDGGWGGVIVRAVVAGPRRELDAYCVALDWPPQASRVRQDAVRYLAELIDAHQKKTRRGLLVAGDFNASPASDEIRALTGLRETAVPDVVLFDAWDMGGDGTSGLTWSRSNPWAAPALLPDRRIDYIFTGWPRGGGVGSVVEAKVIGTAPIDGVVPSDHYAVLAVIRY